MADPNVQAPVDDTATPATSVPSPAPESGNEGANNLPNTQVEETTPQKLEGESGDENLSVEELKQKYSASSKEARLLKEEKELEARKVEELQQELLATVTESKETFTKYLDRKGLSPAEREEYLRIYDTQISKGQEPTIPQATEPPVVPSTPPVNPVRESWMREMDQERFAKIEAQRKASQEFLADPENKELDQSTLKAIWALAEHYDSKQGLKPEDAIKAAKRAILQSEEIKNEGYVEGVRDAYVGGVSKGVSGSSASKGSAFSLPKKDEAFVNAEIQNRGLTGQQAEDFKRDYALRLQRKKE
jgi:hypothetical protein